MSRIKKRLKRAVGSVEVRHRDAWLVLVLDELPWRTADEIDAMYQAFPPRLAMRRRRRRERTCLRLMAAQTWNRWSYGPASARHTSDTALCNRLEGKHLLHPRRFQISWP
jgi:hypothetical protein